MEFPVNLEMWQLIVGIALPFLISIVVKPEWPSAIKYWVAFAFCFAVSLGDVYFSGHFALVDLGGTLLKIMFLCFTSYLTFWKPSGIGPAVEKNVLGGKKIAMVLFIPVALGMMILSGCAMFPIEQASSAHTTLYVAGVARDSLMKKVSQYYDMGLISEDEKAKILEVDQGLQSAAQTAISALKARVALDALENADPDEVEEAERQYQEALKEFETKWADFKALLDRYLLRALIKTEVSRIMVPQRITVSQLSLVWSR